MLHKYLSNYGYHINLDPMIFIIALLISTFVALIAISYQMITAINADPAKSLKYE